MSARHALRRLALLMLLAPALAACTRPRVAASADARRAAAPAPALDTDRYSVWDVGGAWRDQSGAPRPLSSLRGRVQLLAMIYTHCEASCPIVLAQLRHVAAALPAADRDRVGVVLVSLDPRRDDPARLAAFASGAGLDPRRWTLLSGADEDVRALAAVLGIRYRAEGPDALSHGSAVAVLDSAGVLAHQQRGLDGADETIAAVRTLLH